MINSNQNNEHKFPKYNNRRTNNDQTVDRIRITPNYKMGNLSLRKLSRPYQQIHVDDLFSGHWIQGISKGKLFKSSTEPFTKFPYKRHQCTKVGISKYNRIVFKTSPFFTINMPDLSVQTTIAIDNLSRFSTTDKPTISEHMILLTQYTLTVKNGSKIIIAIPQNYCPLPKLDDRSTSAHPNIIVTNSISHPNTTFISYTSCKLANESTTKNIYFKMTTQKTTKSPTYKLLENHDHERLLKLHKFKKFKKFLPQNIRKWVSRKKSKKSTIHWSNANIKIIRNISWPYNYGLEYSTWPFFDRFKKEIQQSTTKANIRIKYLDKYRKIGLVESTILSSYTDSKNNWPSSENCMNLLLKSKLENGTQNYHLHNFKKYCPATIIGHNNKLKSITQKNISRKKRNGQLSSIVNSQSDTVKHLENMVFSTNWPVVRSRSMNCETVSTRLPYKNRWVYWYITHSFA